VLGGSPFGTFTLTSVVFIVRRDGNSTKTNQNLTSGLVTDALKKKGLRPVEYHCGACTLLVTDALKKKGLRPPSSPQSTHFELVTDALKKKGLRPANAQEFLLGLSGDRCPEEEGIKTRAAGPGVLRSLVTDALKKKGLRLTVASSTPGEAW